LKERYGGAVGTISSLLRFSVPMVVDLSWGIIDSILLSLEESILAIDFLKDVVPIDR
jgi:hypothetical protein